MVSGIAIHCFHIVRGSQVLLSIFKPSQMISNTSIKHYFYATLITIPDKMVWLGLVSSHIIVDYFMLNSFYTYILYM